MIVNSDSFESVSMSDYESYKNITEDPSYKSGTEDRTHLSADFQSHANKGLHSALDYISKQSNPNKVSGIFSNAIAFIKDHRMALNRNCTYCSKAVDMNLNSLVKGNFDYYYVATETAQGGLSQNVENMHAEVLSGETPLSDVLGQIVPQGERAIIVVPKKGSDYSHAMNFIHHAYGSAIIDGQFNKVYNFNNESDQKAFNLSYGKSEDTGCELKIVTVFNTGPSPMIKEEDWELIEKEAEEEWELI